MENALRFTKKGPILDYFYTYRTCLIKIKLSFWLLYVMYCRDPEKMKSPIFVVKKPLGKKARKSEKYQEIFTLDSDSVMRTTS